MSIKVEALKARKPLGQVFLERGLVDEEELRTALNLQVESREKIGKLLVDLGYISEKDCLAIVSEHLGIPSVTGADYPSVPVLENVLTYRFMKQCKFVPMALEDDLLTLAMTDPLDYATVDSVRQATGYRIRAVARVPRARSWTSSRNSTARPRARSGASSRASTTATSRASPTRSRTSNS